MRNIYLNLSSRELIIGPKIGLKPTVVTKTFEELLDLTISTVKVSDIIRKLQVVKVIHLPKVGRVADLTPKSYRPINWYSFLLKTLERRWIDT